MSSRETYDICDVEASADGKQDISMLSDPLAEMVRAYIRASKAPATARAYGSDWRHFLAWCEARGVEALPASAGTVALYLASLGGRLRPPTLAKRLSSIAAAHRAAGHPSPASLQHAVVGDTMKGIRRTHGVIQKQKSPLLTADIQKILAHTGEGAAGTRDRAIVLLGFAAATRRSELAAFTLGDLRWDREGAVVTIRKSKTDPEGKGREVAVPRGVHRTTCPVLALDAWLKVCEVDRNSPNLDAPLFRAVDRNGRVRGRPLHPNSVGEILKAALVRAGYAPEPFGGHSLRAGFCTQAARSGATAFDIMRQTGHRSVQTVSRYIREAELFTNTPAGRLGL